MRRFLLTLFAVAAFPFAASAIERAELIKPLTEDFVKGKSNAPVTIIEYASFSCPHCAHFYKDVMPTVEKEYISTGKVRFVYRDMPLNEPAILASQITRCIGKKDGTEKFYNAVKTLFAKQEEWAMDKEFRPKLKVVAKDLGMDAKAVDACWADKKIETSVVESGMNATKVLGVEATPTLFVNGELVEIHSVDEARKALDTALSGKSPNEAAKQKAAEINTPNPDDMVMGDPKAPVTVMEYINLTCQRCTEVHQNVVKALKKDYIDKGKVKLVFREFGQNPLALYGNMVAQCRGKDHFFPMLDKLIASQKEWMRADFIAPLRAFAEKEGIKKDEFYRCIENNKLAEASRKLSEQTHAMNIRPSAAVYVNETRFSEAQADAESIKQAVEAELKKLKK